MLFLLSKTLRPCNRRYFWVLGYLFLRLPKQFAKVKVLKRHLAKQIGVSRFRQKWFSEDGSEWDDDAVMSSRDVQLLMSEFPSKTLNEVKSKN